MTDIQKDYRQDIASCLKYYHPSGETFEIRLKGVKNHKHPLWDNKWSSGVISGYYNDIDLATEAIIIADREVQPDLMMVSVNSCPEDFLARANNRFVVGCAALKDSDITHFDNLFVDFDPIRPSGISATAEEKAKAEEKARRFVRDSAEALLPEPMLVDSGNGYHVVFKIPHLEVKEAASYIKAITQLATLHYSDNYVKVDTSVATPGHMVRVPGTMNRKGEDLPDRPHRRSQLISIPQNIEPISKDRLQAIYDEQKTPPVEPSISASKISTMHLNSLKSPMRFNLAGYLAHYKINVVKVEIREDYTLYVLETCLFNPSHGKGEAAIGQREDGTIFYQCFHDSCDHKWEDAKKIISGEEKTSQFLEGGSIPHEPLLTRSATMAEIARIDFPAAAPLIENIVSANSAAVISGIGGIGKSNLSLNIALALSSPEVISFLGLAVLEQVNVLLVQAENPASDTKNRIEAMSKHPGFKAGWEHFYTLTHNLSDIRILDGDFNDDKFLIRVLEEINATNAGLLIIDPWISFHRGDENDNSAMRRTLDRLTLLMSLTGVAILLLHHVGKGAQDGFSYAGRGAMAVGDWCHNSFLLRVHDKKTNTLELSCQKARNFRKPEPILMKLNDNLVFERVEENGSVSVAFLHRFVVEAVQSQGGTVPTQKDLVDILVKKVPALNNRTKAHGVIRDAVQAGVIVEVAAGRKKSYQLPQQQQALTPANQLVPLSLSQNQCNRFQNMLLN